MARRCLYYPFIHFRDEGWLKLSALYWDDVTRIVPRAYVPRDNREVRALEDAGVVKRVDPGAYEQPVGDLFELRPPSRWQSPVPASAWRRCRTGSRAALRRC